MSPRINSLESLFDKEGLREFGARGLKMEDYQDIRFNVSDGVALIELHRPEHLNTYSGRMGVERRAPQWKLSPTKDWPEWPASPDR